MARWRDERYDDFPSYSVSLPFLNGEMARRRWRCKNFKSLLNWFFENFQTMCPCTMCTSTTTHQTTIYALTVERSPGAYSHQLSSMTSHTADLKASTTFNCFCANSNFELKRTLFFSFRCPSANECWVGLGGFWSFGAFRPFYYPPSSRRMCETARKGTTYPPFPFTLISSPFYKRIVWWRHGWTS